MCNEGSLPSMLMLVHGYSGVIFLFLSYFAFFLLIPLGRLIINLLIIQVGKTLIVNEVHKPLAKSYGSYVSGKFDQLLAASPYSAIIVVSPAPSPSISRRPNSIWIGTESADSTNSYRRWNFPENVAKAFGRGSERKWPTNGWSDSRFGACYWYAIFSSIIYYSLLCSCRMVLTLI